MRRWTDRPDRGMEGWPPSNQRPLGRTESTEGRQAEPIPHGWSGRERLYASSGAIPLAIDFNAPRGVSYFSAFLVPRAESRILLSPEPTSNRHNSSPLRMAVAWTVSSFRQPVTVRSKALAKRTVALAGAIKRW